MKRASSATSVCGGGCGPVKQWLPHSQTDCSFCEEYLQQSSRGRPKKKPKQELRGAAVMSRSGTASASLQTTGMDITESDVLAKACDRHAAALPLTLDRFIDPNPVDICKLCKNAVDNAVEATCCEELYCAGCICSFLAAHATCPACHHNMLASTLKHPGRILSNIISKHTILCEFHKDRKSVV